MKKLILVFVSLTTGLLSLTQGGSARQTEIREEGDNLVISLVTMGPGPLVWERFGHNAISVRDTVAGTDRWYNYGLFSFAQEDFILKFVQGRMLYWMDDTSATQTVAAYAQAGRSVWVQELNLTSRQRSDLKRFLEWNDSDENRFYRYDYYWDNCSTRVRDAIDGVLGGVMQEQTEDLIVEHTFRSHTERLTTNNAPIYTGLMLGLGPMVDEPLSAWDEMFLPLAMRERVREITLVREDGESVPLVKSEMTLFESDMWPVDDAPPKWHAWYAILGLLIAALLFSAAKYHARSPLHGRLAASGMFVWMFVVGIFGVGLFSLWAFTDHAVSYRNENLFLFNPLWFFMALLLIPAAFDVAWAIRAIRWLALASFGVMVVGFVGQIFPGLDQKNAQMFELVLLPNLVALYAVIERFGGGVPALAKVLFDRTAD